MPIGIPSASQTHRYHAAVDSDRSAGVDLPGAIRAYADDLLESGDPRLALERAFRWGYQDPEGNHVPGLQEHIQELRNQRDRLMRSVENEGFFGSLVPELDRLDQMEPASTGRVGETPARSPLERLADRLERGYQSPDAQAGLESIGEALRGLVAGEPGITGGDRGSGQQGSGLGAMRSARSASAETVRRMLFEGGVGSSDGSQATGAWKKDARVAEVANRALLDLQTLADLERIERRLAGLDRIGSVVQLSEADVARVAAGTDDTAEWLRGWVEVVGASRRIGGGQKIALPPQIIRAIGQDLLKGLFRAALSPGTGEHETVLPGTAGDAAEGIVQWEPGKPLDLHLVATVTNAVRRAGQIRVGPVRLEPEDFAVVERTHTAAVSTVLAIDRSRSMGQSGAWTSAKKVGLAMHELIRQSYPRDSLHVIAFSSGAERVPFESIPDMRWDEFEHGTNLQGALALGRQLHRRSREGTRQIVVITDGEPTLATIGGEDVFASPPSAEVLNATMMEVVRCTRENIVINIVMLGSDGAISAFAEQVVRVNRGRIFVATNESLGAYIIRDYVSG